MAIYTPLSAIILYTISESNPETRDKFVELFLKADFEKEGDQSTLLRPHNFPPIHPDKFQSHLNTLCKKLKFTDGDTISLLIPEYESHSLANKILNKLGLRHPILQRYRVRYSAKDNCFNQFFKAKDIKSASRFTLPSDSI